MLLRNTTRFRAMYVRCSCWRCWIGHQVLLAGRHTHILRAPNGRGRRIADVELSLGVSCLREAWQSAGNATRRSKFLLCVGNASYRTVPVPMPQPARPQRARSGREAPGAHCELLLQGRALPVPLPVPPAAAGLPALRLLLPLHPKLHPWCPNTAREERGRA